MFSPLKPCCLFCSVCLAAANDQLTLCKCWQVIEKSGFLLTGSGSLGFLSKMDYARSLMGIFNLIVAFCLMGGPLVVIAGHGLQLVRLGLPGGLQ
jgi:hypothetical protein